MAKDTPLGAQAPLSRKYTGAWWTLPLLTAGIGLIACAMIVGQVDQNRRMAWQKNKMQQDLDYLQKQAQTNEQFVDRLSQDPNLVERLAQRQMRMVREGSAVVELKNKDQSEISSPFRLVNIPPPAPVKPYEPTGGLLGNLFGSPRQRLWAYGVGTFLIAAGLIMGASGLAKED